MPRSIDKDTVANMKASREAAGGDATANEDAPNISTMPVRSTPVIDSEKFAGAWRAKAGLAPHLGLLKDAVGQETLMEIQADLKPLAEMLKTIRLPDTQAIVNNEKVDIPWDVTNFANSVSQRQVGYVLSK